MSTTTSYSAFLKDFSLLFRGERGSTPVPQILDERALKRAYKARIFDCHPDRACSVKRSETVLNQRTTELNQAYSRLKSLLKSGPIDTRVWLQPPAPRRPMNTRHARPVKPMSRAKDSAGIGSRIRFGQFLVNAGVISHQVLLGALAWQASQRPLFGSVAVELGYLVPHQVAQALSWRSPSETIGDAAIRLGFLRAEQRRDILAQQLRHHAPIGDFLVARGHLTREELSRLLEQQRQYNERISAPQRRPVSVRRPG